MNWSFSLDISWNELGWRLDFEQQQNMITFPCFSIGIVFSTWDGTGMVTVAIVTSPGTLDLKQNLKWD